MAVMTTDPIENSAEGDGECAARQMEPELAPAGGGDKAWRDFLRNIRCGVSLAFFRRAGVRGVCGTPGQLALLVLFELALTVFNDFAEVGPDGSFNHFALPHALFPLPVALFTGYLLARLARRGELLLALPVVIYSLAVPFDLVDGLFTTALSQGWLGLDPELSDLGRSLLFVVWWPLASAVAAARLAGGGKLRRTAASAVVLTALLAMMSCVSPHNLWEEPAGDGGIEGGEGIASEEVIYGQPALLDAKLAALLPERRGVHDLYFVGFAGDGSQDVFMKELETIVPLFDRRFDTAGRSIALVNNPETVRTHPLATATGLARTLKRVGGIMNREEDILFLYLTSHGSEEHRLAVDLQPLDLQQIYPSMLRRMLDDAGIRWRVIVVSACYSGGFIEALKDERTLVLTASDANSESFGCESDSDFTWFGKAFFAEELRRTHSFTAAFEKARKAIAQREREEKETPSNPQIFEGREIRPLLDGLAARLDRLSPPDEPVRVLPHKAHPAPNRFDETALLFTSSSRL